LLRSILASVFLVSLAACGPDASPEDSEGPATTPGDGVAIALDVSSGEPDHLQPGLYTVRVFEPNLTFRTGDGWAASVVDTRLVALVRETAAGEGWFSIIAPDGVIDPVSGEEQPSPADLTDWFATHPGLVTTKPSSVQVGNLAARQMEVTVGEGATLVDGQLQLLSGDEHSLFIAPGEKGHIIVIDDPSGPLVIGIRAPADDYADVFRQSETIAGSLTFAG
jgi:hypothetical protein